MMAKPTDNVGISRVRPQETPNILRKHKEQQSPYTDNKLEISLGKEMAKKRT